MSANELAPRFFIAAMVILLVCRLVSLGLSRLGQPPVVGEMIAGVLLGPSLLGLLAPGLETALFPEALRPVLYVAGQIGLVALMFQAGRELRTHLGRGLASTAGLVSASGIVVPLVLGVALTLAARGHVDIFVPGVGIGVSAAFVGVALAITAFPMLARIINERGLAGTRYGSLALASGGVDDAVAWVALAAVLSVASGHAWPVVKAVGGAVIFGVVLVVLVRPLLARFLIRPGVADGTVILLILSVLFAAAWFTDEIGLYAVFGAFSVGLALPDAPSVARVEPTTNAMTWVFVPMFFTYSGLNTRFSLLTDPALLLFSLGAVVMAVAGKFGACWLAARLRGEPPAVASRVGALMNARGLMQLIALNVGLQAHLVNREMFTALVLVALITTTMTAPLLSWLDRRSSQADGPPPAGSPSGVPSITDHEGRSMASLPHDAG
ncbi:cation:proton antiporter [Rugosimonospora acidiphila]|uniref:Cation:proton antiporter n=1 Tax=Rugosimonospora acidiphila TaxID=556531 RepID=A0ABP9RVW9_9ACTN